MLIGKRISGRYKILDMIGGGGMANVYLAHDIILDRDVAVKVLRPDFSNDEDFIRRFHREAQSATSLAHPNIVSIYDVGEEDSIYYIVMEYVDGQTLKQYIQARSPVPVHVALEIMQQLTSALIHAHQNQIVHRDIKPHNILIDRKGNVKITDFGIAMAMSATSITQTNSVLGSVHYLSPEQARGAMANKKSDIYSLGIVMFELLTGRLPFSGESAVSIALKHLQSETPSIRRWYPMIPQSVENIVLRATAKDPFHRYNSVEEMELDLSTALDPERAEEEKFSIPIDNDATKSIPIITNDKPFGNLEQTIVHGQEQSTYTSKSASGASKQPENQSNKKRKLGPILLVSTLAVIVILGVFTVFILPKILAPDEIEVPSVAGYEQDAAKELLQSYGLEVGELIAVMDEEYAEGLIVKSEPKAGRLVKEGSEIDLYISTGKDKLELQNYVDRKYDAVYEFLRNSGFINIKKNEVHHDTVPAGIIIEQSIEPGEEVVPEETTIEFTVSLGPELITLKDLTNFNSKGLEEYALLVGLYIEIADKQEYHDTIAQGEVISQIPAAGTQLKKGEKVTVVLSKGKEEIPPKVVSVDIYIPYEPTFDGFPQTVQIFIEDMDRSMTEPYITFDITGPTTRTITLNIAYGKKAGYKVIRDDRVIEDVAVPYPEED